MNLITKQFNNVPFVFREDGWFNMTKAAKHYGKDTYEFLRLPSTKDYLDALTGIFPGKDLIHVQRGSGTLPGVGTWAHPKLAVFFARWLDVRFAVWCDAMIEDILKGKAEVTITKPAESAVMALPANYADALRSLADAWEKQQQAQAALEKTEEAKARIQREVTFVSIAEWRALRHTYIPHNMKAKLSAKARSICEARGLPVQKQTSHHHKYGPVSINVYRTDVLDDAAELLGVGVAYRPQVA